MQFKFRHTKISLNSKSKSTSGFNIFFTFAEQSVESYQELTGNKAELLVEDLVNPGGIAKHNNLLLISLGNESKYNFASLNKVAVAVAKYLAKYKINEINLHLTPIHAQKLVITYPELVERFLVDLVNELYYFDDLKSEKSKLALEKIHIISEADLALNLTNVVAILEGYFLVRDLANSPANIATPSYLAKIAEGFTKLNKQVKVEVFTEKEIKKLGMHAFLGVAKGSNEEPRLIKLEYLAGKKSAKPIVFVGKGITFDSGGISLKSGMNMDEMKYDMAGAATVLGLFAAVVKLGLPVNLIVLVPACENLPSGVAQKPGDIVKSMAGKTIEILNTDAEGRLILCDALHYAKEFKPELVIDVATLTGACVVALGSIASGLYANDETLCAALQAAAITSNDKVWRMPLFEEYSELIKGDHADLQNIGPWTGKGGSITAACFLQEFVDYKWAHLDIAGVVNSVEAKGSTARPFKLLLEFVRNYVKK